RSTRLQAIEAGDSYAAGRAPVGAAKRNRAAQMQIHRRIAQALLNQNIVRARVRRSKVPSINDSHQLVRAVPAGDVKSLDAVELSQLLPQTRRATARGWSRTSSRLVHRTAVDRDRRRGNIAVAARVLQSRNLTQTLPYAVESGRVRRDNYDIESK